MSYEMWNIRSNSHGQSAPKNWILSRLAQIAQSPRGRRLELPSVFMLFDSAFALSWKIFYGEKRAFCGWAERPKG